MTAPVMLRADLIDAAALTKPAWWTDGCGPNCRDTRAISVDLMRPITVVTHDPGAHEDYGRAMGVSLAQTTGLGVVRTGGIAVDHDRVIILVDGADTRMTPTEARIMLLLSAQLNRTFSIAETLHAVWGSAFSVEPGRYPAPLWHGAHMLRVNISRVRAKLGPWRHLLVTQEAIGYRLDSEAP